jgi:predicted acylesterase/phospholipase RssA
LFHAGVLAALEEMQIPLAVLSTVSGASIIGSFYARGGTPDQFRQRVVAGAFNLRREMLRLDNVVRMLASLRMPADGAAFKALWFAPDYDRTRLQADLLDRVLLGVLAREPAVTGRPELLLNITDIAGGRIIGVTPRGMVFLWLRPPLDRLSFANPAGLGGRSMNEVFLPDGIAHVPGAQRLALLTAASGAFPLALPAYGFDAPYTLPGEQPASFRYLLSDGGVSDNTGLVLLDAAQLVARKEKDYAASPYPSRHNPPSQWGMARFDVDFMLASDGSALAPEEAPSGPFSEFERAMNVMYDTTGGKEMFAARDEAKHPRPPIVLITPRSIARSPDGLRRGGPALSLPRGTTRDWYDLFRPGLPPIEFGAIEPATLSYIIAHMRPSAQETVCWPRAC